MLTCLPSSVLEDIRKLSHTWQPEWMSVCKAFRSATIEYRTPGKTLLVPLWHEEQLADRLQRIAADASLSRMSIRLTNPHVMFPRAPMHLRKDPVKKVPLPENMSAPFSRLAQRRYFRMHHNMYDVAECLVACLESAAALGLSQRIRGMDLYLIAPDNERTCLAYEDEDRLVRLLMELRGLEAFTLRVRAPQFRDDTGYLKAIHSFENSFMSQILSRILATASIRRVTLVDMSFPGPFSNGLGLLRLAENAVTGYFRDGLHAEMTLGKQWFMAHEFDGNHDFRMPNLASRIQLLRIVNVSAYDWEADRFWAITGSHQVARLELVNTQIEWPGVERRGGPTIFPGGRISSPAMTLAISTNTLPRYGDVPFDPAAFAVEGVKLE